MKNKLIKSIIIGISSFIAGMSIGFYFESFFRNIIQDIFQLSTSDKIQFYGKNIFIFSDKAFEYFLGFGLMIFTLTNLRLKSDQILKNVIICLLIFTISIFIISAIDANIKIIECTACDNGIRKLYWSDINYSMIIGSSTIIAIIPCLITIIKQMKNIVKIKNFLTLKHAPKTLRRLFKNTSFMEK